MIIKILKNFNQVNSIVLVLIAMLLWLYPLYHGIDFTTNINMQTPIYQYIIDMLSHNNAFLPLLMSFILIVGQLLLIQKIEFKYQLSGTRNFLASFIFILSSSLIILVNYLHPIIYANIFVIKALERIFDSYNNEKSLSNFFDASFLISVSSFFYFNYIFLIVPAIITVVLIKPAPIREWILIIMGLISAYLFYLCLYFIINDSIANITDYFVQSFVPLSKKLFLDKIAAYTSLAILVLLLLLGVLYTNKNMSMLNANVRVFYKILNLQIISILGMYFIIPSSNFELVLLLSFPLSFFVANFFSNLKSSKIGNIIFLIFISVMIFIHVKYFIYLALYNWGG